MSLKLIFITEVSMKIEYDLQKLDDTLYDFYRVTGVSITFFDTDLVPIVQKSTQPAEYCKAVSATKDGAVACQRSNSALMRLCREKKEPVSHVCAAGLTDIAVPLIHSDGILGYLMLGQIRMNEEFPDIQFDLGGKRPELEELYRRLPLQREETVTAIMHIAAMLTKYILLENMIKPRYNGAADAVTAYVDSHLSERLTAAVISKNVYLSQSGIYKAIRVRYGCTLSEYISGKRIERSLSHLSDSDRSIEDIALLFGFSSGAYYSRLFKKQMGVSPIQYRISSRK